MPRTGQPTDSIGYRLLTFIKSKGLSQSSFAAHIGDSYSNVNKYVNSHRPMSANFIELLITSYPGVDLNWLFKGEVTSTNMNTIEDASSEEILLKIEALQGVLKQRMSQK